MYDVLIVLPTVVYGHIFNSLCILKNEESARTLDMLDVDGYDRKNGFM